jgi:hypothetical protein
MIGSGESGVKIHPDGRYANLYHWLFVDEYLIRGSVGNPSAHRPCIRHVTGSAIRHVDSLATIAEPMPSAQWTTDPIGSGEADQ